MRVVNPLFAEEPFGGLQEVEDRRGGFTKANPAGANSVEEVHPHQSAEARCPGEKANPKRFEGEVSVSHRGT